MKAILVSTSNAIAVVLLAFSFTLGGASVVRADDPEVLRPAVPEMVLVPASTLDSLEQRISYLERTIASLTESLQHVSDHRLCAADDNGAETCLTKSQLDALLTRQAHAAEAAQPTALVAAETTLPAQEPAAPPAALPATQTFDESIYPDFKGQWVRVGEPNWVQPGDPEAPLTPEYQNIYDANQAALQASVAGDASSSSCISQGMPMMMNLYDPMEIAVTPDVTYLLISQINGSYRRIYTDGRDIPADAEHTYTGYSVGRWVDTKGTGHYDELQIETRAFMGPRDYDASGLPLDRDNQSIIKERIYLDENDPDILYDEITVEDHALTHPWTVVKKASRNPNFQPKWLTEACSEDNSQVRIGKEASVDRDLTPVEESQPPADLQHLSQVKE